MVLLACCSWSVRFLFLSTLTFHLLLLFCLSPFHLVHVSKTDRHWKVSMSSSHHTFKVLHRALHIFTSNVFLVLHSMFVCMLFFWRLKNQNSPCCLTIIFNQSENVKDFLSFSLFDFKFLCSNNTIRI